MSSITDEVAELRGTRPATLKRPADPPAPFARLLAAMSVSSFGDWVGFVAVTAIVQGLGGGIASLAISGVMLARTLPAFLFGPIAGSLIDRLDRKKIMIVADIGRATLYLSMAFIGKLWAIYLLSFVIECLSLLWGPARDASLPNMVPRRQLANANSLVLVSAYATLPIGGAAFAVLYGIAQGMSARVPLFASHPESLALVFDAATFLFSAAMVAGIAIRTVAPGRARADGPVAGLARHARRGPVPARGHDRGGDDRRHRDRLRCGRGGARGRCWTSWRRRSTAASPAGGLVVTAFGVGMALGMASANAAARVVERDRVFVWSLLAAAGALVRHGGDAEPVVDRRVHGVARCVLRARVGQRLHAAAGERRRRVPRPDLRGAHDAVADGPVPVARAVPAARAGVRVARAGAGTAGISTSAASGSICRARGSRCGPPVGLIIVAALNTRRLLTRYRLSRPVSLALVPETQTTTRHRSVHRLRRG